MKTTSALAMHPGHDGYHLDPKSGLWLPVALAICAAAAAAYIVSLFAGSKGGR